jgi:hypothetical protein
MKHPTLSLSDWAGPLCFLAAAGLLSAGFATAYGWIILPAASALLLVWWGSQWQGWRWLSALLLVLDVCAAAGGVLLGKNAAWLIAGVTTALAGWELAGQRQCQSRSTADVRYAVSRWSHFRLLAVVIALGLVFAEGGLFLRVSIPFWGIFFAGLLILFSLYRFFQAINHE